MKKSAHIKLGRSCYRLKDAKIFAHQQTQWIQDLRYAIATRPLLVALIRKLQKENGRKWDLPELIALSRSSREEYVKILRKYQPKEAYLLEEESKSADALMINVLICLSRLEG